MQNAESAEEQGILWDKNKTAIWFYRAGKYIGLFPIRSFVCFLRITCGVTDFEGITWKLFQ